MIPVIDLSCTQDCSDSASVIRQVRDAATRGGFFQVVGHGVPCELIDGVRLAARRFFERPLAEKSAACCLSQGEATSWRGYEHFAADGREAFEIGSKYPCQHKAERVSPLHGTNLWPADDSEFKDTVSAYHTEMVAFSRRLLGMLALALGLDEGYFDQQVREPLAQLRLWKYPSGTALPAHKDHGFLTVLLQDAEYGGLQVLRRALPSRPPGSQGPVASGISEAGLDTESNDVADEIAAAEAESRGQDIRVWEDVQVIPHAFVINVGRLFEIFTQQRFPAAIHRVRFAPGAGNKKATSAARISLALFFAPGWEVVIEPPEVLRAAGAPTPRPVQTGPHVLFGYRWQQYMNSGEIEDVAAAKRRVMAESADPDGTRA